MPGCEEISRSPNICVCEGSGNFVDHRASFSNVRTEQANVSRTEKGDTTEQNQKQKSPPKCIHVRYNEKEEKMGS